MAQKEAWEREYKEPRLVSLGDEPAKDVRDFLKFLRKTEHVSLENLDVLDLGSGTGKNANYLAELGNRVVGLEIAPTPIELARQRARALGISVDYRAMSIGQAYPFADSSFDLALDIMTSNSLNEHERAIYLSELHRVLRPGGHFFFRGLCKDGDKHAKNLIKEHPGPEHDTYTIPGFGLTERVFSEQDFRAAYEPHFTILQLEKKTNYAQFDGRTYKRNYWLAYMKKES